MDAPALPSTPARLATLLALRQRNATNSALSLACLECADPAGAVALLREWSQLPAGYDCRDDRSIALGFAMCASIALDLCRELTPAQLAEVHRDVRAGADELISVYYATGQNCRCSSVPHGPGRCDLPWVVRGRRAVA